MAHVFPFCGVRYDLDKVGKLERVTAPPYDVISAGGRDRLYQQDPHNVIRLILGSAASGVDEGRSRYRRARECLDRWLDDGILIRDEVPSMYIYQQDYGLSTGEWKRQRGLVAALRLERPGEGVLPHEHTLAKAREDRLELIRSTMCQFSPLLMLYHSPRKRLGELFAEHSRDEAEATVSDAEGVTHRLWSIRDASALRAAADALEDCDVFIADGHHRYEVARIFREELLGKGQGGGEDDPSNHALVCLLDMEEEPLTILPAHRLVRSVGGLRGDCLLERLGCCFSVEELPFDPEGDVTSNQLFSRLKAASPRHAFGLYQGGRRCHLLTLRESFSGSLDEEEKVAGDRHLDVTIAHRLIVDGALNGGSPMDPERLSYMTDEARAWSSVEEGEFELALFLNATPVDAVKEVALAGNRMPGKATYFYPKALSGLVMYCIEPRVPLRLP